MYSDNGYRIDFFKLGSFFCWGLYACSESIFFSVFYKFLFLPISSSLECTSWLLVLLIRKNLWESVPICFVKSAIAPKAWAIWKMAKQCVSSFPTCFIWTDNLSWGKDPTPLNIIKKLGICTNLQVCHSLESLRLVLGTILHTLRFSLINSYHKNLVHWIFAISSFFVDYSFGKLV